MLTWAVGSYYAALHIIHFDGSYGGRCSPGYRQENIAMPIEYAIPKVHRFLMTEGVRDELCLMASGGIRNAMMWQSNCSVQWCVIGTAI